MLSQTDTNPFASNRKHFSQLKKYKSVQLNFFSSFNLF